MDSGQSPIDSLRSSPSGSMRSLVWMARWGWILLGIGPLLYVAQVRSGLLWIPWYIPGLASLGVVLFAVRCWRQPTWWHRASVALASAFCGFVLLVLLVGMRVPQYDGPVAVGMPIPSFSTSLADGTTWTQDELAMGKVTLVTFFRGRW